MREISKKEFKHIIEFANKEFGVNFKKVQPSIYNDIENYKYHYVYEVKNEILGLFLAKPFIYHDIKFLGIGTLCVKEEYRNKGIMQEMFSFMEEELFKNSDIIYLHGDRKRYERFGFYKSGLVYNLKIKNKYIETRLVNINKISSLNLDLLKNVNQVSKFTIKRNYNDFLNITRNKDYTIYLLDNDKNEWSYAIYNQEDNSLLEINGMIPEEQVIKSLINYLGLNTIYFKVNKIKAETLKNITDCWELSLLANMKIINYLSVIEKLEINQKKIKVDLDLTEKELNYLLFDNLLEYKANKKIEINLPITISSIDGV